LYFYDVVIFNGPTPGQFLYLFMVKLFTSFIPTDILSVAGLFRTIMGLLLLGLIRNGYRDEEVECFCQGHFPAKIQFTEFLNP